MYICIYIYILIFVNMHIYTHIYACTYTYMYICIYICTYVYLYMCICLCLYISYYVCVYSCQFDRWEFYLSLCLCPLSFTPHLHLLGFRLRFETSSVKLSFLRHFCHDRLNYLNNQWRSRMVRGLVRRRLTETCTAAHAGSMHQSFAGVNRIRI